MAIDKKLADQRLAKSGYVEVTGGPKCGNCKFIKNLRGTMGFCTYPEIQTDVNAPDGCCNEWLPGEDVEAQSRVWGDGGDNGKP